jgi:hypothetical protein
MYRRSFAEQHPILLAFGVLFAVAFVITYWPFLVAAGLIGAVVLAARAAQRRDLEAARRRAAIAARADYEHAAIMRGDTCLGTFGQFQPAPWWRV